MQGHSRASAAVKMNRITHSVHCHRLAISDQGRNITATMHDVKDERVVVFNSIEVGVVAYRKTAQTGAQIFITATAKMGGWVAKR